MSITPLRVGLRGGSERRDASFSERILPQLIRQMGASAQPDLIERFAGSGENGGSLSTAYSRLSADDRERLNEVFGASFLGELLSLSRENDGELFCESLFSFAGRLERRGEEAKAELIYESILGLGTLPGQGLSTRVGDRLAALRGGGTFGARAEVLSRHFVRDATDPALIAGMGAAGLVSGVLRLGVLSRLAMRPAGVFTRGFGARFGAGAVSLAFEAPAFTAAVHGANTVLGRPQDLSLGGIGGELASGYLLIGALRLSGGATRSITEHFAASGSLTATQRLGLGLLEHGGTFGAILASHRAEQALNLRPVSSGENMAFDALATLAQFRVGSRIAETALGSGYRTAMREIHLRSESVTPKESGGRGIVQGLLGSLTGVHENALQPAFAGPNSPGILQMSSTRPPGDGRRSGSSRPAALETAVPPPPEPSRVTMLPSAAELLRQLRTLAPKAQARSLKELYENGHLASLALEAEFQARGSSRDVNDFGTARNRLRTLEEEFDLFYQDAVGKTEPAQRWERFQRWQNDLYPNDPTGLARVQEISRAMGLPNFFAFKSEAINLKARVRRSQEAADYFHQLSVVRDFLRGRELNQVQNLGGDNSMLLSNLLLRGDGNCVTLSLLFAHLAARAGMPMEIGLLPRHTFLVAKNGGAIDSILDFGMVLSKPYLARAIGPESKALSAQHLFTLHLLNLGKLGVDRGELGPAESTLTLARDLMPKNPRSYLQLGRLHQQRGEVDLAFQNYQMVHTLHPTDMHRYNSLRSRAWERIAAGRYEDAEVSLRQMNDLQPGDIDALRALRFTYQQSGRVKAAREIQGIIEVLEIELD